MALPRAVTVRLVDLEDVERNQHVVTTQYTVRSGANERRADLVLLVNGLPLVVIEAKTSVRSSQSWFDGATQIHDDYERNVPDLFVPNLCSVATEGKDLQYGSIGLPVDLWGRIRLPEPLRLRGVDPRRRDEAAALRAAAAGAVIDRASIAAEYQELTGGLSDLDREQLSKTAARTAVLLKTPERVERICVDIVKHFQEKVAPNGFGAQVVRRSC